LAGDVNFLLNKHYQQPRGTLDNLLNVFDGANTALALACVKKESNFPWY